MVGDLAAVTAAVRALTDRAKSFGSIASLTEVMVAGLAGFQRGRYVEVAPKRSWFQTVLKGAGLVSSFWLAFRSRRRNNGDSEPDSRA